MSNIENARSVRNGLLALMAVNAAVVIIFGWNFSLAAISLGGLASFLAYCIGYGVRELEELADRSEPETYTCPTCGLVDAESICSAADTLVCLGHYPVRGCGRVLTAEERHYYGKSCEGCTEEWGRRVAAWSKGGADPELDAMFDGRHQ